MVFTKKWSGRRLRTGRKHGSFRPVRLRACAIEAVARNAGEDEIMSKFRVALIPGDGIGKEVMPEALKVLARVGQLCGLDFEWSPFDWSCETWLRTGQMMPEDDLDQLSGNDAILLGAVSYTHLTLPTILLV